MKPQAPFAVVMLAAAFSMPAAATDIAVAADATWHEFVVDNLIAPSFSNRWIDFNDGSPLAFTFTISTGNVGTFSVVDAGFAGDTFSVTNDGALLGQTSNVAPGTIDGTVADTFDAAFADPAYSRGIFTLGAGSYRVSGLLGQSVTGADGLLLNSTNGAVRLSIVAAVPEPSTYALLLAGLGAVGFANRSRSRNR